MAGTCEDVTVRMKKNMLSWFGHIERMSDEKMAKKRFASPVPFGASFSLTTLQWIKGT